LEVLLVFQIAAFHATWNGCRGKLQAVLSRMTMRAAALRSPFWVCSGLACSI